MSKINTGYSLNECPPMKEAIIYSIQQIIVAVFNVIPVPLLIGAGIGLSPSEITILVAGCLFVTGIATILQTIGIGPVGARLPIVLECSFVFVAPGITFGSKYGLNVYTGACLVGSVITLILWTLFHKVLTKMFKPYITGSVVMVLGISLCSTGISYCAGGSGEADFGDPINLLLAAGTIVIMLLLNHYGKGYLSKASALIAIVVMSAVSALFGKLDLSSIANEKWFRIPEPLHFGIDFELGPIVTISILCFIALVELMGDQAAAAMLSEQRLPSRRRQYRTMRYYRSDKQICSMPGGNYNCCLQYLSKIMCCFFCNPLSDTWRCCLNSFWNNSCIRNECHQKQQINQPGNNDCRCFTCSRDWV